jgi:tetratricopeptide (TPR) repeat protein
MKKLKFFIHSTLLATTPSLFAYPEYSFPQSSPKTENWLEDWWWGTQEQAAEWVRPTTYDEIMQMLDDLESGELQRRYRPEQLERVNEYLATLAREGILPNEFDEEADLEEDSYDLLYGVDSGFQLARYLESSSEYMIIPAVLNGYSRYNIVQCGKISKAWKKTKKFCKKHKKAIIIGAAVVVAVAAITVAVVVATSASAASAASTAAAAVGAAGADASGSGSSKSESSGSSSSSASQTSSNNDQTFQGTMEDQITSFKEHLAGENFFQSFETDPGLSIEETGRVAGTLFAHDSFNYFNNQISNYPQLSEELRSISSHPDFSLPPGATDNPVGFGHNEIDVRFSSNSGSLFSDPSREVNIDALSYQIRGEKATKLGYYGQAVHDFGKAIELNPTDPFPYLERGFANFGLRNYDQSLKDFHHFTSQIPETPKAHSFSTSEFTRGFVKGLPKGVLESGKGIITLVSDLFINPIHTIGQMIDACATLVDLARNDDWETIGQALSPELHQLISQWDTLSPDKRGELAGYALGKHGTDIATPGVAAKIASKGIKGAKELTSVCKNLQTAEKTLILESVGQLENGEKIRGLMQAKFASRAEELGFTAKEIAQLEKIGAIESEIGSITSNVPKTTRQNIIFTEHSLQRAIERGVTREAIFDAIESPLKVSPVKLDSRGRPSQRFIGKKAEVVLNPETGGIVSVNPTSTKKAEKLINELLNVNSN